MIAWAERIGFIKHSNLVYIPCMFFHSDILCAVTQWYGSRGSCQAGGKEFHSFSFENMPHHTDTWRWTIKERAARITNQTLKLCEMSLISIWRTNLIHLRHCSSVMVPDKLTWRADKLLPAALSMFGSKRNTRQWRAKALLVSSP